MLLKVLSSSGFDLGFLSKSHGKLGGNLGFSNISNSFSHELFYLIFWDRNPSTIRDRPKMKYIYGTW